MWIDVCAVTDLEPERGAAALVNDQQVALFRLFDGAVLAVQNLDPVSGASVMSRGIVGSRGDRPTLASPVYKQIYDVSTGECLDALGAEIDGNPPRLRSFEVQVADGRVQVRVPAEATLSPRTPQAAGVAGA